MTRPTFTARKNLNQVQLELARLFPPCGDLKQGKNKKPQGELSDLAVQTLFYLIAYYATTMPYLNRIVKVYYLK